jgi:hypothetical protein
MKENFLLSEKIFRSANYKKFSVRLIPPGSHCEIKIFSKINFITHFNISSNNRFN